MITFTQISPERASAISEDIHANSHPNWRFYALLITASMIACFGLSANSTAVIIGAMLVSPLMTPIFGMALGMLQGDVALVRGATRAEAGGVLLAIGSACLVGFTPLFVGESTHEMITRTQPNLIDLLVAIFAGFAGAYAMVDERISPALPGVAIATAIVPPLSTCGLCLSIGAWSAAGGAMLLFLANFVSILIVALVVFGLSGLGTAVEVKTWRGWIRRFGPTAFAFLLMAIVLTKSLLLIIHERHLERGIRDTLVAEFSEDRGVDLEEFIHNFDGRRLQVLATVRAPRLVQPHRVTHLQEAISKAVGVPVDLVVRTSLSGDMTAYGSNWQVNRPNLKGGFLSKSTDGFEAKEALATQVIYEHFETAPGFELTRVDYGTSSRGHGIVLAYINALSRQSQEQLWQLEQKLRDRLQEKDLHLVARIDSAELQSSNGPFLIDFSDHRGATDSELAELPIWSKQIKQVVSSRSPVMPLDVYYKFSAKHLHVMTEIAGPNQVPPSVALEIEQKLSELLSRPIRASFWHRNDYIVNSEGYTSFEEMTGEEIPERGQYLQQVFDSKLAADQ